MIYVRHNFILYLQWHNKFDSWKKYVSYYPSHCLTLCLRWYNVSFFLHVIITLKFVLSKMHSGCYHVWDCYRIMRGFHKKRTKLMTSWIEFENYQSCSIFISLYHRKHVVANNNKNKWQCLDMRNIIRSSPHSHTQCWLFSIKLFAMMMMIFLFHM